MNWAWATSLDEIWRSPDVSDVADAGGGGILRDHRADHAAARREIGRQRCADRHHAAGDRYRGGRHHARVRRRKAQSASAETRSPQPALAGLPALSCLDDLAGEVVLAACEKALFGSSESAAAAVSYAASQITRLTAFGDVAAAGKNMTPELQCAASRGRARPLRPDGLCAGGARPLHAVRMRGLPVADRSAARLSANMDERIYDGLVVRYAPLWNAPPAARSAGRAAARRRCRPANPPMPISRPQPRPRQSAS